MGGTAMHRSTIAFAMTTSLVFAVNAFAAEGTTTGPNGEKPTPAGTVVLTDAEVQQIKDGKFTAALVWHEMSEYTNAVNRGAQDEFKRLGITVVAQTDAGFDASRQK